MKQFLLIVLVTLFITACQSETAENENSNTSSQTENVLNKSEEVLVFNPEHGKSGHRCDLAVGAPLPAIPAKEKDLDSEVKQVKINPEHGKPGHRCDTPVGAPLT